MNFFKGSILLMLSTLLPFPVSCKKLADDKENATILLKTFNDSIKSNLSFYNDELIRMKQKDLYFADYMITFNLGQVDNLEEWYTNEINDLIEEAKAKGNDNAENCTDGDFEKIQQLHDTVYSFINETCALDVQWIIDYTNEVLENMTSISSSVIQDFQEQYDSCQDDQCFSKLCNDLVISLPIYTTKIGDLSREGSMNLTLGQSRFSKCASIPRDHYENQIDDIYRDAKNCLFQ